MYLLGDRKQVLTNFHIYTIRFYNVCYAVKSREQFKTKLANHIRTFKLLNTIQNKDKVSFCFC